MKKIVIKIIIFVLLLIGWNSIALHVNPLIQNSLAMNQMQNDVLSNIWIQVYTYLSNYSFVIFLLVALLLFYKDIKNLINTKEKKNNENA